MKEITTDYNIYPLGGKIVTIASRYHWGLPRLSLIVAHFLNAFIRHIRWLNIDQTMLPPAKYNQLPRIFYLSNPIYFW